MKAKLIVTISFLALSAATMLPGSVFAWNLQGSCVGSPLSAEVGDVVTWTAAQTSTLQPGQGHYEWVWSGTEGLSGTTQSISKTYTSAGTKTTTVIIKLVLTSSKIESITRTCSVVVTSPPPPTPATLKIIKRVINDNGGAKTPADFTVHVKNGTTDVSGSPAAGSASGIVYTLSAGVYTVSEDSLLGYTQTGISGDCAGNGNVVLASGDSKICTIINDDSPPSSSQLDGVCAVTPSAGVIGSAFLWSASTTGGTGSYTYLWSGDEGLPGTAATVAKTYSSVGTKAGTVVITSGNQSITRECSISVTTTTETPFDGVCSASPASAFIGDTINWNASATGGTGSYAYAWSGDGGLSGSSASVSRSYGSAGIKQGTVEIASGGNSVTRTCSVSITPRACQSGCGGGYDQPNVVLYKKATSSPLASASIYLAQIPYTVPVVSASVYLSQIPYTGITENILGAILYATLLLGFSGFLAYIIIKKRAGRRKLLKKVPHIRDITNV